LLTLLGAAGEQVGLDRMLKANTVKRRTHSLLRQGWHYYRALPMMKPERFEPLIQAFAELVRSHVVFRNQPHTHFRLHSSIPAWGRFHSFVHARPRTYDISSPFG
jgi:hypothetical protein